MAERSRSRRERRITARKAQILDAAAQVFAEKGFARATTKEIADAADVSEGTIYNYFDSKEDLLIALMTRMGEMQLTHTGLTLTDEQRGQLEPLQDTLDLEATLGRDAREFFVNLLNWRHSLVSEGRPMFQALLSEMLVNADFRVHYNQQLVVPFLSLFERQVEAWVERGEVRALDVPLTVRFLFAVNLGMLGLLILGDPLLEEKWESEELIRQLADFFLMGLGARESEA
jgi:AcrR family transcriptional regulator